MTNYLLRRFVLAFFTIWAISLLSFFIIQLPENTVLEQFIELAKQGELGGGDSEEQEKRLKEYMGIDKPIHIRYIDWVWPMIRYGELGLSFEIFNFFHERTVKEMIGDRIFTTIALTLFTALITWTLSIPIGIYSAVRQHSVGDYVFTFIGFTGLAVPEFLLGLLLMYFAYAYFEQSVGGLLSADFLEVAWFSDGSPNWAKIKDLIDHLWIPAIVLGTSGTASLIRVMRNNLLDELNKPYVITAVAKGLSPWRVILKYPVRVAINPLVSTVGYLLPALISGSIIVSEVLSLPTLGPTLLKAILRTDMHLAAFIILMMGVLTVVGTLLSDILLGIIDPRIKLVSRSE